MDKNKERAPRAANSATEADIKETSEGYFADFDFGSLDMNVETLFKAGVHFGHHKSRKNPKMEKYIFTSKKGVNIIDLQKTFEKLKEALEFLKETKKSGKQILLVGTKKQIKDLVRSAAQRCNMPYVNSRWLGGTFTNFKVIRSRAKYLKDSQTAMEKGEYKKYTKLERLKLSEKLKKLEEKMGGIKNMVELPGAIVVMDVKKDELAIKEAIKTGIPVVAIVDTNNDPEIVDYPIPGNDDAVSSVRLILAHVCKVLTEENSI